MQKHFIYRFLNDLPILPKLLLIPTIPFLSLILFSGMLYMDVRSLLQDEERLNDLYLLQKTAAQYMQHVVDLQSGFRGYVISQDDRFLKPYEEAREGIARVGRELAGKLSQDQEQSFTELENIVTKYVAEKEELIKAIKSGKQVDAVRYIQQGRGLEIMAEIRKWMTRFDQAQLLITQQELARVSYDRKAASIIMLGGGLITLCLVILALTLIARSIASPLVDLSRVVGSSAREVVPNIPVFDRQDEIGDLTRVMQKMSLQIRQVLDNGRQSEADLRWLNVRLSASEAKYRGLVDNAPLGIFMTRGVRITFSNRYNQELAGLDPQQDVDPATFRQRIHPEDRDRVLMTFSQAVAQGRPCEMIFRFLHDDGSVRTILSRHVPIMDLDSLDVVYVGFNIDITTLDNLQSRLRRADKLATLGQVAAGIAHELRNPLVGIGSTAKVLLDEIDLGDPVRGEIEVILSETRRLDRIVDQIVDYARPRRIAPTRVDLIHLVDEVSKVMRPKLEEKRLSITTSFLPMIGELNADRDQLRQVLLNVVHNAIDATPSGGQPIEITTHDLIRDERPGMVIQVRDAGSGIPDELLPHIFQPFVTSGKRRGTGLGLAICKNIIESHEGDIYVASEVGKGTTIGVWLPLKQDALLEKGWPCTQSFS
jgi:PAS domain S-box-containing protein